MVTRVWHLKTLQTLISWLPGSMEALSIVRFRSCQKFESLGNKLGLALATECFWWVVRELTAGWLEQVGMTAGKG